MMSSHTQQDEHLDAIITGKTSASDNLAAFLVALDKTEDDIKAWCLRSDTRAHAQAEACDAAPVRGALHGVCVGVKDIIDTADMLTERGSRSCAGRQPDKDADLVSALRAAGAILPGKTATTEFAYLDKTVTRNPHNLAHSPGGSSSGSAAAIAAGQIPLAIGTQTGGSVIRPASYCGVFGMKPSFGSISRAGVLQTSQTLDQVGVFASTLTGIGRLCDVIMTGAEGMMQATQSACDNPRCLVFDGLYDGVVESGAQDAVSSVTASLGAAVTHIPAPEMIASYLAGHKAVYHVELAQNLGAICDAKSALVGPAAKATVAIGRTHHSDVYDAAQGMRVRAIADLSSYFTSYDVLITPAATSEAPLFDDGTGNPTCNALWSFVGFPCITLPLATGPTGLPVGVQLIGAMGADKKLLQIAKWLLDTYHDSRSAT